MIDLNARMSEMIDDLEFSGETAGWLRTQYFEPHRYYHNYTHILALLDHADDAARMLGLDPKLVITLKKAIWFHDSIYVIGAKDNESQSAIEAYKRLLDEDAPVVHDAILVTKDHTNPQTYLEALMIDVDLAGLGSNCERYAMNSYNVRAEIPCKDEEWVRGRSEWLWSMLRRPTIYYTAWGQQFDFRAKANMVAELDMLSLFEERFKKHNP